SSLTPPLHPPTPHSFPTRRSSDLGITRAGCPNRTALSPKASSFSSTLSTARLLGAHTSTRCPRRSVWRTISTTVVVLPVPGGPRSEEHTSELQSRVDLVCRLLLET